MNVFIQMELRDVGVTLSERPRLDVAKQMPVEKGAAFDREIRF